MSALPPYVLATTPGVHGCWLFVTQSAAAISLLPLS